MDQEYSAIDGNPSFRQRALRVAWGDDCAAMNEGRMVSAQTLSGTGSLRVGFEFLKEWYPKKDAKIFVPDPTWPTHNGIGARSGFEVVHYRYYDAATKGLNFAGMSEDLDSAPNGSIVVLHPCAHNPTGCDPTHDQWRQLADLVVAKGHFICFDSAYQGFASGDLDRDAFAIRHFATKTNNICLFQSFAKNFGLYGQRVGCTSFLTADTDEVSRVTSRLRQICRPMYSNPPLHGARIVDIVLGDEQLTKSWHGDLKTMSGRMMEMRTGLVERLTGLGSTHDWSHITS
jgi:aspartate aminotransferase, mitochondrial